MVAFPPFGRLLLWGGYHAAHQTQFLRCYLFVRNALEVFPRSVQKKLHAHLRPILDVPDGETARKLLAEVVQEFATVTPKAIEKT
jgi:transposase-like protein